MHQFSIYRTYVRYFASQMFNYIMYWSQKVHKKMKFSIKDFFSKCEQIRRKLRICSHLLKKSLMENFVFCAVQKVFARTIYLI